MQISRCLVAHRSFDRAVDLVRQFGFSNLVKGGSHRRCLARAHVERFARFVAEFDAPSSPMVAVRLDEHWAAHSQEAVRIWGWQNWTNGCVSFLRLNGSY